MKIPKTKIEQCVSEEESRYTMQAVLYDPAKKHLVSTDGHMLAVVPHESDIGDKKTLIPLSAFKEIRRKGAEVKLSDAAITVKRKGEEHIFDEPTGQFPKYESLIPNGKEESKFAIALNAELLLRLACAITNADSPTLGMVKLYVRTHDQAVIVKPLNGDGAAVGLLMPIRSGEEQTS